LAPSWPRASSGDNEAAANFQQLTEKKHHQQPPEQINQQWCWVGDGSITVSASPVSIDNHRLQCIIMLNYSWTMKLHIKLMCAFSHLSGLGKSL